MMYMMIDKKKGNLLELLIEHYVTPIVTKINNMNKINEFVKNYNNNTMQQKYKFKLERKGLSYWEYKVGNIELRVFVKSIEDTFVDFYCVRKIENNVSNRTIKVLCSPDYVAGFHHFLNNCIENAETLAEAESNMKF